MENDNNSPQLATTPPIQPKLPNPFKKYLFIAITTTIIVIIIYLTTIIITHLLERKTFRSQSQDTRKTSFKFKQSPPDAFLTITARPSLSIPSPNKDLLLAIYMPGNGRANIAGIPYQHIEHFGEAVNQVRRNK